MRKLTETDVRWLAKGYWGNHFNWRIHPKTKTPFALSGIALLVLATLAIVSAANTPVSAATDSGITTVQANPALGATIMTVLLICVAALFWGLFVYFRERDDFIDRAVQQWEKDEALPDRSTVTDFINKGG